MTKTACVIPSCRRTSLDQFLEKWYPFPWNRTIVVWDGDPADTPDLGSGISVYCWQQMCMTEAAINRPIFSRGDSAIRCYGFLKAVAGGADYVFTLDDDCYPEGDPYHSFVERHFQNLHWIPAAASSVPGVHVRGLPYGDIQRSVTVGVSMGLWMKHADMDSIHTILKAPGTEAGFMPPRGVRVMSPDQLFPFCGMNFAFRSAMLPALFFPRMGTHSKYSRFDDIWAGLVMQKAAQAADYGVVVGEPFVIHDRASKPLDNHRREAPGLGMNEWLWEEFSKVRCHSHAVSLAVLHIADHLNRAAHNSPDPSYVEEWALDLKAWLAACSGLHGSE